MNFDDCWQELRTLNAQVDRLTAALLAAAPAPLCARAPKAPDVFDQITRCVALRMELPQQVILGRRRTPRTAWARQVSMFLVREISGDSLEEIGRLFHRDHGTVAHALRAVENRCCTEPAEAAHLHGLLTHLREFYRQNEARREGAA